MDVEACAAESPKNWTTKPRYALVMTNVGVPSGHLLQNIRSMKAAALAAGAEILVLLKKSDAEKMSSETQYLLKKWGVEVRFVPWSLPPKMIYEKQSWCGQMDFIRLHVLALEDFDAVAYYDVDCEFQGDILPVLQCASRGFFLTTSGGVGEDLNVGFFAVRPDQRLLDAAVYFASHNNFSREDAWGHSGWRPRGFYYVGGECGQGFFYNLFYSRSEAARQALEAAGLWPDETFQPFQLDRCIWNYQTSWGCQRSFDCDRVRVHHKPTKERGSKPNECEKLRFREKRRKASLEKRRNERRIRREAGPEELFLRHWSGLCVGPDDDDFLRLMSCIDTTSVLRLVEDEEALVDDAFLGHFYLHLGPQHAIPSSNVTSEPRLRLVNASEMNASEMAPLIFRAFKVTGWKAQPDVHGIILQHRNTSKCVHPLQGKKKPMEGTPLLLHSDCDRKALVFQAPWAVLP